MKFKYTTLRTSNIEKSIFFYTKILGLTLIDKDDNKRNKYSLLFFGHDKKIFVEIIYNYGIANYILGDQFAYITLQVNKDEFNEIQNRCNFNKIKYRIIQHDKIRKIMFIKDHDEVEYGIYFKDNKEIL